MPETILIVDDDISQLHLKEQVIRHQLHYQTLASPGNEKTINQMITVNKPAVDMVLIDLETLGSNGIPLLQAIKALKPELPVLAFVPYGDEEQCSAALATGAYDFMTKPVALSRMRLSLQLAMKMRRMNNYIGWLERKIAGHVDFNDLIGNHPQFKHAIELARAASASKAPVWIEGEAGTGKEMLARAIHGSSDRAGKAFVVVNCRFLPEHFAEVALFGQERGYKPSPLHFALGKLREGEQGTVLLKEIHALAPELQQKLLDVVQTGQMIPVGGTSPVRVDVRLVCSSSRAIDKPTDTRLQKLRHHLITLPPVCERRGDLTLLAEHFLLVYAASENKYIQGLSGRALQWIENSLWPGNVAQLANVIWRAVLLCDRMQLDVGDLQGVLRGNPMYLGGFTSPMPVEAGAMLIDETGQVKTLKSVEEEAIRFALKHADGCMTRAAKSLGIGRSTLYRKVGELEIDGYISRANHTMRPTMNISLAERS